MLAACILALSPAVAATPLEVVAVTPSSSDPKAVSLQGQAALTITFSRPVIALGSDFLAIPEESVPFVLSPAIQGDLRWVTTSVARFDPTDDWPPNHEPNVRTAYIVCGRGWVWARARGQVYGWLPGFVGGRGLVVRCMVVCRGGWMGGCWCGRLEAGTMCIWSKCLHPSAFPTHAFHR